MERESGVKNSGGVWFVCEKGMGAKVNFITAQV